MRSTRVVEAVVHGIDVADALGRPASPTGPGLKTTALIFDEPLARRTAAGRPTDLIHDGLAWVRAASGGGRTMIHDYRSSGDECRHPNLGPSTSQPM
jgi:hypothetical protein